LLLVPVMAWALPPVFTPGFKPKRGAAAAASGFESNTVSGMVRWYAAFKESFADNDAVTTATDYSGLANNAGQPTAGNKPTFKTSIVNSKAVFRFDGSADRLTNNLTSWGTIFGVAAITTPTADRCWAGARGTSGGSYDAVLLGTWTDSLRPTFRYGVGDGSAPVVASGDNGDIADDTFVVWIADIEVVDGTTYAHQRLAGLLNAAGTTASAPLGVDIITIGAGFFNNNIVDFWPGDIAEYLVYGTSLAISNQNTVGNYLATNYNVSFTPLLLEKPTKPINSNSGSIGTAEGDLDNDGDMEFASAASAASADAHLRVLDWNGSGWDTHTILADATVEGRRDRYGTTLTIEDVNGDGWKDIITVDSANGGNAGTLYWYENPDGALGSAWTEHSVYAWSGTGGTSNLIVHAEQIAGDVDDDGDMDIVVRDISHGLWVAIQQAPGDGSTWSIPRFVACNPREGLELWDPDLDDDLDILINGVWFEMPANPLTDSFTQRAITGMASWYPGSITSATIDEYACKVLAVDVSGDGKEDVIITNAEELSASASKPEGIRVFIQPADPIAGTWTEVTVHASHYSWHNLKVVDMDGDGDLDIVTGISGVGVDTQAGRLSIFLNNGSGTVWTERKQRITEDVYSLAVGDADGDGKLDVLAPDNWNSGPVRFLRNVRWYAP
jgi:hypothetical protein